MISTFLNQIVSLFLAYLFIFGFSRFNGWARKVLRTLKMALPYYHLNTTIMIIYFAVHPHTEFCMYIFCFLLLTYQKISDKSFLKWYLRKTLMFDQFSMTWKFDIFTYLFLDLWSFGWHMWHSYFYMEYLYFVATFCDAR